MKVHWIVPENEGGIATYARTLFPVVANAGATKGKTFSRSQGDLKDPVARETVLGEVARVAPDVIHIQHEYGLFGSKVPGFDFFKTFVRDLRRVAPRVRVLATAHSVIPEGYRYPVGGRGPQAPLRMVANLAMPFLQWQWNQGTWSLVDGVIVHSELQAERIKKAVRVPVTVIPHFVEVRGMARAAHGKGFRILVFGYFTPEKGQDLLIRALPQVLDALSSEERSQLRVVFAGGVRRPEDRSYFEGCEEAIRELRLSNWVDVLGFTNTEALDSLFAEADLVVAPFRETTGSGSLAQAMGRGKAVLTSDLPLNLEIERREPGALAFFRSEDTGDLAGKILGFFRDRAPLAALAEHAIRYGKTHCLESAAERHRSFYRDLRELARP